MYIFIQISTYCIDTHIHTYIVHMYMYTYIYTVTIYFLGLPWQCSGEDSMLLMQALQAQSLVRKLRSHMLHGKTKK